MEELFSNPYAGLLGQDEERIAQQARMQGLLGLASSLFEAGAPSRTRQGLGQAFGRGIQAYQQGAQGTFDQALRAAQVRAAQTRPTFEKIKVGDVERLVQITPDGKASLVTLPGIAGGVSPKFDAATSAFLNFKYPGKSYSELTQDQQREIIQFADAPDATKASELQRESEKALFETGVRVPVPRGRSQFLQPTTPAAPSTTPVAPTSVAPTSAVISPVAAMGDTSMTRLSVTPVSQDLTPRAAEVSAIKMSPEIASKPLGEKEKPLIDSAAITPKAKQELLLAQPKQTQAVEYVLETNAQMLSVIDELLANPGFDDAFGFAGETISKIPGTNAARVRALLERLGGNLFIEAITAMRAASATGAAVGNATEKEGDKLQGSRAALMQAQKAEDAKRELETLRDTLRFQQGLVTNAYERTYGRGAFVKREPKKAPEQRKPLQSIFGGQ